jgi:hypothetical protein
LSNRLEYSEGVADFRFVVLGRVDKPKYFRICAADNGLKSLRVLCLSGAPEYFERLGRVALLVDKVQEPEGL